MFIKLIKLCIIPFAATFSTTNFIYRLTTDKTTIIKPIMINNDFEILNKLIQTKIYEKPLGHIVVQQMSNILPKFDSVSHIVLTTNSNLIDYIISDIHLSNEEKKKTYSIYY